MLTGFLIDAVVLETFCLIFYSNKTHFKHHLFISNNQNNNSMWRVFISSCEKETLTQQGKDLNLSTHAWSEKYRHKRIFGTGKIRCLRMLMKLIDIFLIIFL